MEHKTLWAPWRIDYILSEKDDGCIFCKTSKKDNDRENLILNREEHSFAIMNKYPYNSGHLMVVPYKHTHDIEELSEDELLSIHKQIRLSIKVLKKAFNPDGFNVGLNIGKAGGAGIDEHLHYHVIPRWVGDNNFMPVISDTRIVPQSIYETYDLLKNFFKNN